MAYLILGQRVPAENYRDEIGVVYNYPKRYWKRIHPGDYFIYHQPRSNGGRGSNYFGCGLIGDVQEDMIDPTRRNAEILDYVPFPRLVPVIRDGTFIEPLIRKQVDMFGNAVREIDKQTALIITNEAGVELSWSWGDQLRLDLPIRQQAEPSTSELYEAVCRFDEQYAALPPERRRTSINLLNRPSSVASQVN